MRNFIGVTLATLLSGCGGGDADGVYVTATWTFRSVTANTPIECPVGFPSAVLSVRGIGGGSCSTGCTDVLACSDGTGTSRRLVPGTYEVSLAFQSADHASTYATTLPERLDLSLGDKTYARQILVDGGVFAAAWNLVDGNGATLACEDAGVVGIVLAVENEADPSITAEDELDCEAGAGRSFGLPEGSYTVTLQAIDDAGQTIGQGEALVGQVIEAPHGETDLGAVDVVISRP